MEVTDRLGSVTGHNSIHFSHPSTIFPQSTGDRGGSTGWDGLNLDAHSGNLEGGPASSAQ